MAEPPSPAMEQAVKAMMETGGRLSALTTRELCTTDASAALDALASHLLGEQS